MKLPRDVSGDRLVRILSGLGYEVVRSSGSHVRMEHPGPPVDAITIPLHKALKAGTLSAILNQVARHLKMDKNKILQK